MMGKPSASCVFTETPFFIASPRVRAITSAIASLISRPSLREGVFLTSARIRPVQSLDFGLGLLEPGGLDDIPTAVSPCQRKLVGAHHIQDFKSSACRKRVGAQYGQALIGNRLVETLFIFAEVFPVLPFQPGRIP